MDIIITTTGVILSSFTTGLVPSRVSQPVANAWRKPGEVVFDLLDQARDAALAGRSQEAKALEAKAERLFDLVPM